MSTTIQSEVKYKVGDVAVDIHLDPLYEQRSMPHMPEAIVTAPYTTGEIVRVRSNSTILSDEYLFDRRVRKAVRRVRRRNRKMRRFALGWFSYSDEAEAARPI